MQVLAPPFYIFRFKSRSITCCLRVPLRAMAAMWPQEGMTIANVDDNIKNESKLTTKDEGAAASAMLAKAISEASEPAPSSATAAEPPVTKAAPQGRPREQQLLGLQRQLLLRRLLHEQQGQPELAHSAPVGASRDAHSTAAARSLPQRSAGWLISTGGHAAGCELFCIGSYASQCSDGGRSLAGAGRQEAELCRAPSSQDLPD